MQKALADDNHIIETAANAKTAMMKAEIYDYDCILLDIMLPDGNGLDVLRQLKASRKRLATSLPVGVLNILNPLSRKRLHTPGNSLQTQVRLPKR